jgi:hypothetical protein
MCRHHQVWFLLVVLCGLIHPMQPLVVASAASAHESKVTDDTLLASFVTLGKDGAETIRGPIALEGKVNNAFPRALLTRKDLTNRLKGRIQGLNLGNDDDAEDDSKDDSKDDDDDYGKPLVAKFAGTELHDKYVEQMNNKEQVDKEEQAPGGKAKKLSVEQQKLLLNAMYTAFFGFKMLVVCIVICILGLHGACCLFPNYKTGDAVYFCVV